MGQFVLKTKFEKNRGLLISPAELVALYFYGITIASKDGSKLDTYTIRTYIQAAQEELERYFGIKLLPQLVTESQTYYRDDYSNGFPYFSVDYLVNRPLSLNGLLGTVEQIHYPDNWLVAQKSNKEVYGRIINLIPTGNTVTQSSDVILSGVLTQLGLRRFPNVPHYWSIQYVTGFNKIPYEILHLIGMMSSIPLMGIAGDLILGAGIASQSVSLDGLSQSISSTSSATNSGYGARIIQYQKSIKETLLRVARHYKRMRFTSL